MPSTVLAAGDVSVSGVNGKGEICILFLKEPSALA